MSVVAVNMRRSALAQRTTARRRQYEALRRELPELRSSLEVFVPRERPPLRLCENERELWRRVLAHAIEDVTTRPRVNVQRVRDEIQDAVRWFRPTFYVRETFGIEYVGSFRWVCAQLGALEPFVPYNADLILRGLAPALDACERWLETRIEKPRRGRPSAVKNGSRVAIAALGVVENVKRDQKKKLKAWNHAVVRYEGESSRCRLRSVGIKTTQPSNRSNCEGLATHVISWRSATMRGSMPTTDAGARYDPVGYRIDRKIVCAYHARRFAKRAGIEMPE